MVENVCSYTTSHPFFMALCLISKQTSLPLSLLLSNLLTSGCILWKSAWQILCWWSGHTFWYFHAVHNWDLTLTAFCNDLSWCKSILYTWNGMKCSLQIQLIQLKAASTGWPRFTTGLCSRIFGYKSNRRKTSTV